MADAKKIFSVFRPFHPASCEEPPYHEWIQGEAKRQVEQEAADKAAAELAAKEASLTSADRLARLRKRREAEEAEKVEKARLLALANELAAHPTDPNIIPTMSIDVSDPKRSEVVMDDPPIWLVPFERFKRHGQLPVYPELVVPLTSVDLPNSFLVFVSHAWVELPGRVLQRRLVRKEVKEEKKKVDLTGFYFDGVQEDSSSEEDEGAVAPVQRPKTPEGATKALTMPDTFSNSKWELLCEAIQKTMLHYAPEMEKAYLWIDVACVPSEHVAAAEAEAKRQGLKFGPDDIESDLSSDSDSGSEDEEKKKKEEEEEEKKKKEEADLATSTSTGGRVNPNAVPLKRNRGDTHQGGAIGNGDNRAAPLPSKRSIETGPTKTTFARKAAGTVGVLGTAGSAGGAAADTAEAGVGAESGETIPVFVPKGPKPLSKQEIRKNNRERDNDPDVSIGKQLNSSSMSQWGLLLFDRVMMYMDCMLTVVPDEGFADEPWALSNSGLGMHYDYKAQNWQRYLSRRWCRLEMSYCSNIPFLPEEEYQVCVYVLNAGLMNIISCRLWFMLRFVHSTMYTNTNTHTHTHTTYSTTPCSTAE